MKRLVNMNDSTPNTFLSASAFIKMFNISNESVDNIDINYQDNTLIINISLMKKIHNCPVCKHETNKIKDYYTKTFTHQIITNQNTKIFYKARRYICPNCSKTFYEDNPFIFKNTTLSPLTVFNVLDDLKKSNETFSSVANRYFLSITTIQSIFDTHVKINRSPLPEILLIDEVYIKRGSYACVMVDFKQRTICELLAERKKDFLVNYLLTIPIEERKNVKYVCCDMWETYRSITQLYLPNTKVIVDKFHIIQELSRRVEQVRIEIMKNLKPQPIKEFESVKAKADYDEQDKNYYLMKKFNWTLFNTLTFNPNKKKRYNKKLGRYLNIYDIKQELLKIDPLINKMDNLYFYLSKFFKECTIDNAREELDNLIKKFEEFEHEEVAKFANTLKRWKNEIINSFIIVGEETISITNKKTKETHKKIKPIRVSNGVIERVNKTIKDLKRNANGYNNFERFRQRVFYVVNKNSSYTHYPASRLKRNKRE